MRKDFESRFFSGEDNKSIYRTGTVVDCNPTTLTVDVKLLESEYLTGVPVVGLYGASYGRDLTWLHSLRGASVILLKVDSQYMVIGTVPSQVVDSDIDSVTGIHEDKYGGSSAETYQRDAFRNFHSGRPQDFLPGDQVIRNSSGALLGLFTEGVALLKASPLCQIIMGRFKDFVRVITRRFQMFTDFGEFHVEHTSQGRVGASLHGGAEFTTETHPQVAKWTVQAWVGDDPDNPDNRLHIRVNDAENSEFVTMEFDIKGNMVIETSKDRKATHGQDEIIDVARDRTRTVGGDESVKIGGISEYSSAGILTIKSSTSVVISAPKVRIN